MQVWLLASNQGAAAAAFDLLQDHERLEFSRFVNARDRCRFAVTRAALRCLLASEIDVSPKDVSLVRNAWGKPLLSEAQHRPELDFSVSHAGDLSVIAISRCGAVGIDIEHRHHVCEMERIAVDVFDEATASALRLLPPAKRDNAFLRLWTAGEACLKAMGLGFAGAGGRAPVGLSPEGSPQIRPSRRPPGGGDEWSLHSLDLPPEYVGTLVARHSASAWRLHTRPRAVDVTRLVPAT